MFKAEDDGRIIGVLVPADFEAFSDYPPFDGARAYVTPPQMPLQIVAVTGPRGARSTAHIHNWLPHEEWPTRHKALICLRGSVRVYLSDIAGARVGAPVLNPGDVVLCVEGHQIEMLEDGTRLVEVKQGPYAGSQEADRETIPNLTD